MKTLLKHIIVSILSWQARMIVRRFKPTIVAITGSVGKTTTKDAIAHVLSHWFVVRKSQKSYNSEIGLPLTIIGASTGWSNPILWLGVVLKGFWVMLFTRSYPSWLVLEAGIGKPGDMDATLSVIQPDIAVFTRLSEKPVHVEYFDSREHLYEEKMKLAAGSKDNTVVIWNHDDSILTERVEKLPLRKFSYGEKENASVHLYPGMTLISDSRRTVGMTFRAEAAGKSLPVSIDDTVNGAMRYVAAAALAVAHSQDLNLVDAIARLGNLEPTKGRMRLIAGLKHSTIIDDTYNSSPDAAHNALSTLKQFKEAGKKTIAVMGDMLELGNLSDDAHREVGQQAATIADALVTVGVRSNHHMVQGALAGGMHEDHIHQFENSRDAGKFIESLIEDNTAILVKGSQGLRMERTVKEIMSEPERAGELLVRQEAEWLAKK